MPWMAETLGGLVQARSSKGEEGMGRGGVRIRAKACMGIVGGGERGVYWDSV